MNLRARLNYLKKSSWYPSGSHLLDYLGGFFFGDNMLTQERLKEKLSYDPKTGSFSRVVPGIQKVGTLNGHGYIQIMVDYKLYMAHRLAYLFMTGAFPTEDTDHENGVRDDNRWNNLRGVTRTENLRNQRRRKDNTSGVVGVYWYRPSGKWKAQIRTKGKHKHLGYFNHFFDAVCKRKSAEDRYGYHINHGR